MIATDIVSSSRKRNIVSKRTRFHSSFTKGFYEKPNSRASRWGAAAVWLCKFATLNYLITLLRQQAAAAAQMSAAAVTAFVAAPKPPPVFLQQSVVLAGTAILAAGLADLPKAINRVQENRDKLYRPKRAKKRKRSGR